MFIVYLLFYFAVMGLRKRSFTYSGNPVTWRDAKRKAKKEGRTFSEVVELLLQEYNKAPIWKGVADGKPVPTFPLPTSVRDGY